MTDNEPRLRRELLQKLLWTYGPGGQEGAVRDICRSELEPFVDAMWVDKAGNLVGFIRGGDQDRTKASRAPPRIAIRIDQAMSIGKALLGGDENSGRIIKQSFKGKLKEFTNR